MPAEIHIEPLTAAGSATRRRDVAIAGLAGCQHGIVSRPQLLELGFSRHEITARVEAGLLHRVHLGVYAVGHRAVSREGELLAAVLAGGKGAALGHRSAAELWELRLAKGRLIDVIADTGRNRPGIRFHRNAIEPGDITTRKGIPVTAPLRTIIDLAAATTPSELERAIRQAQYDHLLTTASLASSLSSLEGRRGIRALRAVLASIEDAPGIDRSKLERRFLAFVRKHGLPSPKLNVPMCIEGRDYEADCVWENERLIVELDSHSAHDNGFSFESDRARDRALQANGWTVIRITWRQLHDEPAAIAAHMRALLAGS